VRAHKKGATTKLAQKAKKTNLNIL